MSQLVDYINNLSFKESLGPCSEASIRQAQEELGLTFADEYVELLRNFGAPSLEHIDICSTLEDPEYNVVSKTKELRNRFSNLSADLYVVVDAGVDDVYALQNRSGKIFEINGDEFMEAYGSLYDFIKDVER